MKQEIFIPLPEKYKQKKSGSQPADQAVGDLGFLKIINQDQKKIDGIVKIEDPKLRKDVINEHIKLIISDLKSNSFDNLSVAFERLSFLKHCGKLNEAEINNSWEQEDMDKFIDLVMEGKNEIINSSSGYYFYEKISNYFYTKDSKENENKELEKNGAKECISDFLAKTLTKKISSLEKPSYEDQEIIFTLSKALRNITIGNKIDFLLEIFKQPGNFFKLIKDSVIGEMMTLSSNDLTYKNIENYLLTNINDTYKSLRTIEFLEYAEKLSRPEISHKRIRPSIERILVKIREEEAIGAFVRTKSAIALDNIADQKDDILLKLADQDKIYYNKIYKENDLSMYHILGIKPDLPTDMRNKEWTEEACGYRKLSDKYGVVYTPDNKVNCFFERIDSETIRNYAHNHFSPKKIPEYLEMFGLKVDSNLDNRYHEQSEIKNLPIPKKLTLDEILEKEGFSKKNIGEEEYKKLIFTYEAMMDLSLKSLLEFSFDINLSQLSIREQIQFMKFLSTKTQSEMRQVADFLKNGAEDKDKINRMRSFLSMELGENMGKIILAIGEGDKKIQQAADLLFAEFAKTIDNAEKVATEVETLYAEIFPDKHVNQQQILDTMILQGAKLLLEGKYKKEVAMVNQVEKNILDMFDRTDDKNAFGLLIELLKTPIKSRRENKNYQQAIQASITGVIEGFRKQQDAQSKALNEFKEISLNLSRLYLKYLQTQPLSYYHERDEEKEMNTITENEQIMKESAEELLKDYHGEIDLSFLKKLVSLMDEKSGYFAKIEDREKEEILKDNFVYDSLWPVWEHYKKQHTTDVMKFIKIYYNIERNELKNLWSIEKKFDSQKIKHELETMKDGLDPLTGLKISPPQQADPLKIRGLESMLRYQTKLELQLEKLIYGQESSEVLAAVFSKYNEIVSSGEKMETELRDILKEDVTISDEDIDKIKINLIQKADEILNTYTGNISNRGKENMEKVLAELEKYKVEQIQSLSILKSVKEKGVHPEDIRGIEYQEKTAGNLVGTDADSLKHLGDEFMQELTTTSPTAPASSFRGVFQRAAESLTQQEDQRQKLEELWQMLDIYRENWKKYPALRDDLIKGFISKITGNGEKTKLHMYKNNNDILVFLRIDTLEGDKKYFGSFNTASTLKGLAAGTELLTKVLEKELKDEMIEASSVPQEPISSVYIERFGFVVKGLELNHNNTGVPLLLIERNKEKNAFHYKNHKKEDIIKEYNEKFANNKFDPGGPAIILKFDKDSQELIDNIDKLTNKESYIISRYFFRDNEVYCVFEKSGG